VIVSWAIANSSYSIPDVSHDPTAATLRTANENITRVKPLIIMLTPTNVPIAHIELEGHCR